MSVCRIILNSFSLCVLWLVSRRVLFASGTYFNLHFWMKVDGLFRKISLKLFGIFLVTDLNAMGNIFLFRRFLRSWSVNAMVQSFSSVTVSEAAHQEIPCYEILRFIIITRKVHDCTYPEPVHISAPYFCTL